MERSRRRAIAARIINPFIPQSVRDASPEVLFRARVLVAVLIFNGLVFLFTRPLGAWAGYAWPLQNTPLNWLIIGATVLVHVVGLLIFRRTGSFLLAGNVFVGWIFALITVVATAASGPGVDRTLRWLLLVPLYGFLTMGLRWGLGWTLLAFAVSGALHAHELPFLSTEYMRIWWDWTMLAVTITVGLMIYENVVMRLLGLLDGERRRFAHAALHDPLTGLANRAAFDLALERRIADARGGAGRLALAYVDLDGFKPVNDTWGHQAGDRVLQVVARRLEGAFRDADLVARLGGDEFAVIIGPDGTATPLEARVEQARRAITVPIGWEGRELAVTASIGVALRPGAGDTPEALLAAADAAMYRAKERRNRVLVDDGRGP